MKRIRTGMRAIILLVFLCGCDYVNKEYCLSQQYKMDAFFRCKIDEACALTQENYMKNLHRERQFLKYCRQYEDG
jgi:hypothetical protein